MKSEIETFNLEVEKIKKKFIGDLKEYGYDVRSYEDPLIKNWFYGFQEVRLYATLDFERCSENFFSRWLCYLAHGKDACGSKKYSEIKKIAKKVYEQIEKKANRKEFLIAIGKERMVSYFEMNREMFDIKISVY